MVAVLDPITGLAVRLVHVNIDGSIALVSEDVPPFTVPTGVTLAADVSVAPSPVVPAPAKPEAGSAAGAAQRARPRAAAVGRLFKAWVRVLPAETSLTFGVNTKNGKSAQRFALYRVCTTVGAYRLVSSQAAFVHEDLAFDLSRGLAQLPPSIWTSAFVIRFCLLQLWAAATPSPATRPWRLSRCALLSSCLTNSAPTC